MPATPTWSALIGDLLGGRDLTIAEAPPRAPKSLQPPPFRQVAAPPV